MQRTRIEWVKNLDGSQGYTWNPIKGLCPVGCWYCYARRMYKRFRWMDKLEGVDEKAILMKEWELYKPAKLKKPSKIFVCSTIELFHPKVIFNTGAIFNVIKENPQHTFQILTKFPQNIDRPMPDNVWLGTTVTGEGGCLDRDRLDVFRDIKAKVKFISYEPVLSEVGFEEEDKIDWLIIGALTGYSYENRRRPHVVYLQRLVKSYKEDGTKIFLKNNLKALWKQPLIQEFPACKLKEK